MTTPQDLLFVALDVPAERPVPQGDLSLALAGAELLDLLRAGVIALRDDRIMPLAESPTGDRLLDEAEAALLRTEPYERAEDWLWRRGDGLAAAYAGTLDRQGGAGTGIRQLFRRTRPGEEYADSPARRRAADRWAGHEPVLVGLAAALGIEDEATKGAVAEDAADDRVAVVLAAVGDALTELEAVRQRRQIEEDAFDNVWRAP